MKNEVEQKEAFPIRQALPDGGEAEFLAHEPVELGRASLLSHINPIPMAKEEDGEVNFP